MILKDDNHSTKDATPVAIEPVRINAKPVRKACLI